MSSRYFLITTSINNPETGASVFFVFESTMAGALPDLYQLLAENLCLIGRRWKLETRGRDKAYVTDMGDYIVGIGGVVTITEADKQGEDVEAYKIRRADARARRAEEEQDFYDDEQDEEAA